MNYYELLEVSPKASDAVIRAAYKSLMQRYHPDKNAGSADAAERAVLVVRAYEILSDADKRSAYDLELKRQAPRQIATHTGTRAPQGNRRFWPLALVLGAAIVFSWGTATVFKATRSPPKELAVQTSKASTEGTQIAESNSIPAFIISLNVTLADSSGNGATPHALSIPIIDLGVGGRDPGLAIKHLNNTSELIREKLQENLATAKYEELIKPDGERYLTSLILATVTNATGTADPADEALRQQPDRDRYGAVEVVLPRSYSVR